MSLLKQSGIKRVFQYTASPVEACDRCSAGIKYVTVVEYRDGSREKYGSECINKILAGAPDMLKLYQKNAKLLKRYQDAMEIFSRKPEDMPRGSEYFNSGYYFIADSTGKDIFGGKSGHWYFHPLFDVEKNQAGTQYVWNKPIEAYAPESLKAIEADKPWFAAEIARIEIFLARILTKIQAEQQKQVVG